MGIFGPTHLPGDPEHPWSSAIHPADLQLPDPELLLVVVSYSDLRLSVIYTLSLSPVYVKHRVSLDMHTYSYEFKAPIKQRLRYCRFKDHAGYATVFVWQTPLS
jgi:hypothetical protein